VSVPALAGAGHDLRGWTGQKGMHVGRSEYRVRVTAQDWPRNVKGDACMRRNQATGFTSAYLSRDAGFVA
jgi:hypothetical protein